MRVLIVGRTKRINDAAKIYGELVRAGHVCAFVDDRKLRQLIGVRSGSEWLRARAAAFRPDRILTFKPHDVTLDVYAWLAERFPTTLWYRDLTIPPDPEMRARARHAEVTFLAAAGQADLWRADGAGAVHFLPSAADPAENTPQPYDPAYACDIAFIGRGYDDYRAEFLCRLAERFHVRVWGYAWDRWAKPLNWDGRIVYDAEFATICASARIVLDINPSFNVKGRVWGYLSNRVFKTLASRGFLLGHATPGVRTLFTDDVHMAWYDDEAHAFQQIERYLHDDAARARIAGEGHRFVLQHHTYAHRIPHLLHGTPWHNPLQPEAAERAS